MTGRGTTVVGIVSIVATVFVFTPSLPEFVDLVDLSPPGAVAFLVMGSVAVVAGARRMRTLAAVACLGFFIVAVLQIVQLATGVTVLGGDASSLSLFIAGALALFCLLWADHQAETSHDLPNG